MAKVALLIGISEYQEPTLAPLPKAVEDVEAMRRVLENPEMGGFDDVTVLKNPKRQELEREIYNLYANRQKDDLVLLYFSGHGVTVENGDFYFSTWETQKNQNKLLPFTSVAATSVHRWMNESKSKRRVVILDCCFSGAFAKGLTAKDIGTIALQQQLGGEGTAILTASTSTQYAFESDELDLSIYTQYLVEGIEKGAADKDGDGLIAVDELHDYAKTKVQEASPAMTPEFYPFKDGYRIFLAKSPKDDPKLKYRKEVERRINQGKFTIPARRLLNSLRLQLQLDADVADAIEVEVKKPYLEYQRKLEEYEATLVETVESEPTLSERTLNDLRDYQQHLGLRDEDVAPIEKRIIGQPKPPGVVEELPNAAYPSNLTPNPFPTREEEQESKPLSASVRGSTLYEAIQTNQFEFEIVKVDAKGQIINRSQGRAEYFTEDLGHGVVLEMVAIPGGTFLMGSPESEEGRCVFESPQHHVIVQPFFMGKFPVTQGQWQAVAALDKVNIDLDPDPSHFQGANRPVECVSWDDAVEFCARLSKKTGKIYRLPSEAEWEYACRAGTTTPFYFGETITTELANYNGNYIYGTAPNGEYRQETTEVGKFPANPFGLFDMCGNVSEWCQDKWHKDYNNAPTDGSAWLIENNNQIQRWLRGGSWPDDPRKCRSASRYYYDYPDYRNDVFGFRVVVCAARA
ncbi:SUMF1/EgtB/PvdO family nonheme iron enzyme [Nostoc spongiaeforme FACHB-130]|uniref:SUMF1/EgtB/PvdO family nonheme iron enzyme n=1 Tax=Nostoc spongiaeforme FACHB-130 TaxID=1357510 RepID=A0ABR8G1G7_9NOSO|nr:SUMF1/EgtB/PvdO family nonheme iron enzyme [Nostoc spongiaeforme]MBD2597076.1 SUMF1/EgtB/PvdO family nonheme iron enzyme [Nostoc spongiaeforme FACHB-130]